VLQKFTVNYLKLRLKVVEGLSGFEKAVSFQSQNFPDYYLTHKDGLIRIENLVSDPALSTDATWIMVDGLWPDDGGDTYSLSYPTNQNSFVRHQGYRLKMHENDQSELFYKDCSFNIRQVGKTGHWNDIHCETEFASICQYLPYGNPPPTMEWPPSGGCPTEWYQFAGNCYRIPITTNTAADLIRLKMQKGAQEDCLALDLNANLAIIINKYHQAFLSAIFVDIDIISRPYIGVESTANDHTFIYPTKQRITYSNWAPSKPNSPPDGDR